MSELEPSLEPATDIEALTSQLFRKEGSWVEWGQACQKLQKAGQSPQAIFEAAGFEPIHQNQLIVASQVYAGLVADSVASNVLEFFERKGSDILYELRILSQVERAAAAELAVSRNLDAITAKEVAKAVKEMSILPTSQTQFTTHPGDAVAFQAWRAARQTKNAQEKVRLISRGLKFAHTDTARTAIENLLTETVSPSARKQPRLPVYRLDSDDNMPRSLPVVGRMPLTVDDLKAVPLLDEIKPFGVVKFAGESAWVAIPGWQVVRNAEDGVVILTDTNALAELLEKEPTAKPEELLIVCDRAQRQWDDESYFLIQQGDRLQLQWFDRPPELPILGKVLLVMRPHLIFDEELAKDAWQLDD